MDTEQEIKRTCSILFEPGQVVEVRVLGINSKDGFNAGGWFDDPVKLAEVATRYDDKEPNGIYVTMNMLHEACLSRSGNRMMERTRSLSSDRDIIKRHWLLIDVDATRPSGVSATTNERNSATQTAQNVKDWLKKEFTFPEPVEADSGNGTHLLYRIDEENCDDVKNVVHDCLIALGRFDTSSASIDIAVYNAARIIRLYGTKTRKGIHSNERPHRQGTILSRFASFGDVEVVDGKALRRLASRGKRGRKPMPVDTGKVPSKKMKDYDVEAFIEEHGIRVKRTEPWDGGTRYILERCVFDDTHTNTSAALGKSKSGAVFYKCHHSSCDGRQWKDVRSKFERWKPGRKSTKTKSESDGESKPDPFELARDFIEEECVDLETGQVIVRRWRHQVYFWDRKRGCYRVIDEDGLKVRLYRHLDGLVERVTVRLVSDVRACFESLVTVDPRAEMPFISTIDRETMRTTGQLDHHNWLALSNGIIDIDKLAKGEEFKECFMDHTPTWFSVTALPFSFPTVSSELECCRWLSFLDETFDGDEERISLIQESFGYCFERRLRLETFFVFHGTGRNGKSTVLDVLGLLLGEDNVSSLTVDQFSNRFMVGGLQHVMANLCADMREIETIEEGLIKRVVSSDPITADRKHLPTIQFRTRAVLFFCTNTLPKFKDTSMGIWRRMRLIPFDNVVPINKVDIGLRDKLKKELPGIFLWSIKGLASIRKNKRFVSPDKCQEALYSYRLLCFPVMTFMDECCTNDASPGGVPAQLRCGQLWRSYRTWCGSVGLTKPKPLHTFIHDILSFDRSIQYVYQRRVSKDSTVLYGIRLVDSLPYLDTETQIAPPLW